MLTDLLSNLCSVPGVRGAAIYTEGGHCVDYRFPTPYDQRLVQAIVHDLFVAFESYAYLEPASVSMAMMRATDGFLAFMATNRFRVLAITETDVNLAFLNVSFGALRHKLTGVNPDSYPTSSSVTRPPHAHDRANGVNSPERSVVELAPARILQNLIDTYAEYAGPAARLVVKEELRRLGFTASTLPRNRIDPLVARLSARLRTQSERATFLGGVRASLK